VMSEYIAKHGIRADSGRVRAAVEEIAATYQNPQEVIDYYFANRDQLAAIESKVLEDLVVEKLLENADVSEKKCSYQEAIGREPAP